MNTEKIAMLYEGWNEALIWSCLQGHMGHLVVDDDVSPKSALIDVGDFCFFAGKPNPSLFNSINGSKLLIPQDKSWEILIEKYYDKQVIKMLRYAIKKEPDVFNKELLSGYVSALEDCYEIRLFDEEIFNLAQKETWSIDLCSQFKNYSDYKKRGLGVAILHQGELVSGASPYAVYNGGIEIEIDTKPEYRQKGLATVCGAKLILECLARKLYPSWDAHDLRSVALAEKLGYHLDRPYTTYVLSPC